LVPSDAPPAVAETRRSDRDVERHGHADARDAQTGRRRTLCRVGSYGREDFGVPPTVGSGG